MPSLVFSLARVRRLAARPAVRRAVVVVLAVVTGLAAAASVRAGDAAVRRWGVTRPVAVARHDLAPGDTVDGAAVEVRRLPDAVVPERALAEAPVGAVVRRPVVAGEALVAERLAPDGLTGAAALVPAGHRALAVPVEADRRPPLQVGDLVDLIAVNPVGLAALSPPDDLAPTRAPPTVPLARAVPVVAVDDRAVTVAVPRADVDALALTLAQATVVVALVGA